jgi:hypothetical protein
MILVYACIVIITLEIIFAQTHSPTIITYAGTGNNPYNGQLSLTESNLYSPDCVFVDVNDYVWICDHNNYIRVVKPGDH